MWKYRINVARRVAPDTQRFGPYHRHHFGVTLEHSAAEETRAKEVYEDLLAKYPEPQYRVTISRQNQTWREAELGCWFEEGE